MELENKAEAETPTAEPSTDGQAGVEAKASQENEVQTDGTTAGEAKPKAEPTETKTFTQEMVDEIVRNRLERDRKATFKRYGVGDRDGLDALIGKSQAYDVMKERYEGIKTENSALREKMALMSNNINPAREGDVRAHFKGKGIEFNETNLVNELATHPEWLNVPKKDDAPKTTITTLGVEHTSVTKHETEEEKQRRIFGV